LLRPEFLRLWPGLSRAGQAQPVGQSLHVGCAAAVGLACEAVVADTIDKEPEQQDAAVENRWWVDTTGLRAPAPPPATVTVGHRFFRAGDGFEQEPARDRLTDNNLKILVQAQPPEGGWAYVRLTDTGHPRREQDRIRRAVNLPNYARAVLVDSGKTVRVLVTGTPIGGRILEFTFGYAPSFDCWVRGEWVEERLFRGPGEALRNVNRLIRRYLALENIARDESLIARA